MLSCTALLMQSYQSAAFDRLITSFNVFHGTEVGNNTSIGGHGKLCQWILFHGSVFPDIFI